MDMITRIKELAQANGYTIASIERELEFGQGSIRNWNKAAPSADKLFKVAQLFSVPMEYILTGRSDIAIPVPPTALATDLDTRELLQTFSLLDTAAREVILAVSRFVQTTRTLPQAADPLEASTPDRPARREGDRAKRELVLYDLPASAGTGQILFLDSEDYSLVSLRARDIPLDTTFGVRIRGDSMTPRIEDGQIALVKQQPTVESGEIGIFVLNNEGYCKQYTEAAGQSSAPSTPAMRPYPFQSMMSCG